MLSTIFASGAFAKSTSSGSYSFLLIHQGKIIHSWEGSQSDTQKLSEDVHEIEQISLSDKASASSLAVSPLIVQESSCPRSDYFELEDSSDNYFCFAYQGTLSVSFYNIIWINPGNNEGNFQFYTSLGGFYSVPGNGRQICKYDDVYPSDIISGASIFYHVSEISIANPTDPCQAY